MIRIRRTYLDEFRKITEGEWGDEDRLKAMVKGEPYEVSDRMRLGTAWHTCLELAAVPAPPGEGADVIVGGFGFRSEDVNAAREVVGWGVREIDGSLEMEVHGEPVLLTARADHVAGLTVTDHKTTLDSPDLSDYEDSLQWRVYLLVHHCRRFRYLVWQFRQDRKSGVYELRSHSEANFYHYEGMEHEVKQWVARFLDWSRAHLLTPYLEGHREATAKA
jgi:hypothetical protein